VIIHAKAHLSGMRLFFFVRGYAFAIHDSRTRRLKIRFYNISNHGRPNFVLYNFIMPNLTGKMLGKVRVDMFLAHGGMADVFIGTHTTLHRAVAVKFLKGDVQDEPELRERFEREARVIAMLRHPNIVQVYDFDTFEKQPYLVMEYIPGASLANHLRELHKTGERLDLAQINSILDKLADALKYAHDNDVIHRDVKPGNILLNSRSVPVIAGKPLPTDVQPILTDFGLVRFAQSKTLTSTGTVTGTPAYMSPEQALGKQVDSRTDVYSLGISVYEMLAGRIPFDSDSALSLLHMHIYDPPPPIEGLSKDLQDVVKRALAKDPDQRFQTPVEFARAFHAAISGKGEAATLPLALSSSRLNTNLLQPKPVVPKIKRSATPILVGVISLAALISLFAVSNVLAPSTQDVAVVTPTRDTLGHVEAADTPLAASPVPAESEPEPIGLLRFQDGTAPADLVTFSSVNMPPPPEGTQYEAWLITDDGEGRISIGFIKFDQENRSSLTFVDVQGRNLLGLYHALEITIEPDPDNSPSPSNNVAFFAVLPRDGFTHVRHLLFSFSATPNEIGFIHGLQRSTALINDSARTMLTFFEARDKANVRLQAERMLSVIVGNQSADYKDWNNDGDVDDPGDGFGLLLNGENIGYIQGTFTHADLSTTSPDANQNMLIHGEHVKVSATNIGEWTPQLRDLLIAIVETSFDSAEMERLIRQVVALANQIQNGIDINGNESVEPIPGEGGARTAYEHAYYMADILVFP
jgi:serine/threonine protein kinase